MSAHDRTAIAMRRRDFAMMQRDTATPLESGRVAALAYRCEVEGLGNCADTLRGLLAEVATLRAALHAIREQGYVVGLEGDDWPIADCREALADE